MAPTDEDNHGQAEGYRLVLSGNNESDEARGGGPVASGAFKQIRRPNSAKELTSISMPTMAVTSVTDAAGPEPISIRAMIKSSTPITNCSQLPAARS